jgi:uncharacterized protein (DUF1778 family)
MARKMRAEANSKPTPVRLSPAEAAMVKTAAKVNHQSFSQFARDALIIAAGDCLEVKNPRSERQT